MSRILITASIPLRLALVLAFFIVVPQSGGAQAASALREGVRIEITPMKGKPQTGRLLVLRNDSLFYSPLGMRVRSTSESGAASLPFAEVRSVRVSRGRNVLLGVLVKGLIGTALGAGSGAMLGAATWSKSNSNDFFLSTRGGSAATFGVLGGAIGLVFGSIYGGANGYERWETVALPGR